MTGVLWAAWQHLVSYSPNPSQTTPLQYSSLTLSLAYKKVSRSELCHLGNVCMHRRLWCSHIQGVQKPRVRENSGLLSCSFSAFSFDSVNRRDMHPALVEHMQFIHKHYDVITCRQHLEEDLLLPLNPACCYRYFYSCIP